jgi:hypothetical protein
MKIKDFPLPTAFPSLMQTNLSWMLSCFYLYIVHLLGSANYVLLRRIAQRLSATQLASSAKLARTLTEFLSPLVPSLELLPVVRSSTYLMYGVHLFITALIFLYYVCFLSSPSSRLLRCWWIDCFLR